MSVLSEQTYATRYCNPEFYGDLVYKFKKIFGNPNFSNLLKGIVNRFKKAGYSLDIMLQIACLVLNPIMVEDYAGLRLNDRSDVKL